jgi:hypothetical protein
MSSLLLVDNFFDTRIYPDHVLDAEEEASGHEVERVASGRRAARDHWEPTTANSETFIEVVCDRVRAANCLIIDREHNLSAEGIELRVSSDDFTTFSSPVDIASLPSSTSFGHTLAGPVVRTFEGAFVCTFDLHAGTYWRLYVDAMGAGLVPEITGVWLGLSFAPSIGPLLAGYDDEAGSRSVSEVMTTALWAGTGREARRLAPSLTYRMRDESEWSAVRYHAGLYHDGHPMWVVQDDSQAERAFLARMPSGAFGFPFSGSGLGREFALNLPEHQPRARRAG